jgi:hypothetical protein
VVDVLITVLAAAGIALGANPDSPSPGKIPGNSTMAPDNPVKTVEEPMFTMPELVIIGENQARIMAQKEQMAGTPAQGLREAPLLEKEEGSVSILRQREPPPREAPPAPGTHGVVKLEGGHPAWLGGEALVAKQSPFGVMSLELGGSRLNWNKAGSGTGYVGGWDSRVVFRDGFLMDDAGVLKAKIPVWLLKSFPGGYPDGCSWGVGWEERQRDLPWITTPAAKTARRRSSRVWLAGEGSRNDTGSVGDGLVDFARAWSPAGSQAGVRFGGGTRFPLWRDEKFNMTARVRGDAETADVSGDHLLPGATVEAAWTPAPRWRYLLGLKGTGLFGGGIYTAAVWPVGGVSWTTALGPTVTASFNPSMNAPWLTRLVTEVPYSYFSSQLTPERELANAQLDVRQEWWDDTFTSATYSFRRSRGALSWVERPGEGLYEPVALSLLTVQEIAFRFRYTEWRPVGLFGEARWRHADVSPAGRVANLPWADGQAGVDWSWRTVRISAAVEVVRSRPRSAFGTVDIPPFADLGLKASWKPVNRVEIYAQVSNLTGAGIERWGGYPEPKRLLSAGALASF